MRAPSPPRADLCSPAVLCASKPLTCACIPQALVPPRAVTGSWTCSLEQCVFIFSFLPGFVSVARSPCTFHKPPSVQKHLVFVEQSQ